MRKNEGWQVAFPLGTRYAGLLSLIVRAFLGGFGYPNACFLAFGHTSPQTYAEGTGV
jgi:hypothetical protein